MYERKTTSRDYEWRKPIQHPYCGNEKYNFWALVSPGRAELNPTNAGDRCTYSAAIEVVGLEDPWFDFIPPLNEYLDAVPLSFLMLIVEDLRSQYEG